MNDILSGTHGRQNPAPCQRCDVIVVSDKIAVYELRKCGGFVQSPALISFTVKNPAIELVLSNDGNAVAVC